MSLLPPFPVRPVKDVTVNRRVYKYNNTHSFKFDKNIYIYIIDRMSEKW